MRNEQYIDLFQEALKGDGTLFKGFSNFHSYSWLNQLWAMSQMHARGIKVGPIATYKRWAALGRQVQKGSKAIALLMPVTVDEKDENGLKTGNKKRLFLPKNNWFTLAQTEGEDVEFPEVGFDWDKAFAELNIQREEFQHVDGNVQGYATVKRTIAINPLNTEDTEGTLFHEIGHIVLGHLDKLKEGEDVLVDTVERNRNLQEVEAEGVALCCKLALGLGKTEYQVGYIRNWWKNAEIPAENIKRIFKATNEILKAGQEKPAKENEEGAEKTSSATA